MGDATLLRVIAYQNPGLLEVVRGQLTVPAKLDHTKLRSVFNYTHIIHNSYDDMYNMLVFLACGLKMYSPESLVADCKVRNGVAAEMARYVGLDRTTVSSHINKYVRFYYEKRRGFAELVDGIVERLG